MYITHLKPVHIVNYCSNNNINISEREVNIIYDFIMNNYLELLENEDTLLKLKPLISDELFEKVVIEYKKNKAKYF